MNGPLQSLVGRVPEPIRARVRGHVATIRGSYDPIDGWWIAGLVVAGAYVFLQNLGRHPLRMWDESIYGSASRNVIETGHALVPHLHWMVNNPDVHLQPFLEKPPLVLWLQALSMAVFDVSLFALRLPGALFAIAAGLLSYRIGTTMFDRGAGLVAAVVVFTTPMIYAGHHGGRTGNTDTALLFFGTLFVYLAWRALTEDDPDLLPYVGLAAGLTLMVKGFNAGVFVVAIAPVALYHYRTFLHRKAATMVGVTALVSLPWPLFAWYRYGEEFLHEFLFTQVIARATGEMFYRQSGTLFPFMRYRYFAEFPEQFDPWVYVLFPAVAAVLVVGRKRDALKRPLFLVWWAASTFALFVPTGNHGWYIMPMFVPCGLLIGKLASDVAGRDRHALVGGFLAGATLLSGADLTLGTVGVLGGLVAAAVVPEFDAVARSRLTDRGYRAARRAVPVALAALLVVAMVGSVPLGEAKSGARYPGQADFGKTVADEVPEGETIAVGSGVTQDNPLFVFAYYAEHRLESRSREPIELEGGPAGDNITVTLGNSTIHLRKRRSGNESREVLGYNRSIEYLLVRDGERGSLFRDHRVVATWRNLAVVAFNGSG